MLLTPRATAELRRRCSSAEDAIALLLRASDPDHFTDSVVCKSRNNYFRVQNEGTPALGSPAARFGPCRTDPPEPWSPRVVSPRPRPRIATLGEILAERDASSAR